MVFIYAEEIQSYICGLWKTKKKRNELKGKNRRENRIQQTIKRNETNEWTKEQTATAATTKRRWNYGKLFWNFIFISYLHIGFEYAALYNTDTLSYFKLFNYSHVTVQCTWVCCVGSTLYAHHQQWATTSAVSSRILWMALLPLLLLLLFYLRWKTKSASERWRESMIFVPLIIIVCIRQTLETRMSTQTIRIGEGT